MISKIAKIKAREIDKRTEDETNHYYETRDEGDFMLKYGICPRCGNMVKEKITIMTFLSLGVEHSLVCPKCKIKRKSSYGNCNF
jgi:hypothetical protein